MKKMYECLIIDLANLCYFIFQGLTKDDSFFEISSKDIIRNLIYQIEGFKNDFLLKGGRVYFLIDDYKSNADLKTSFLLATPKNSTEDLKKVKRKENKDINFCLNYLKYYLLNNSPNHYILQMQDNRAYDLVHSLLEISLLKNKSCLLISGDSNWDRFLKEKPPVDFLNLFDKDILSLEDMSSNRGFPYTFENVALYDSIFGNLERGINKLLEESDDLSKEFAELLKNSNDPKDFIFFSRTPSMKKKYKILQAISQNEKGFEINFRILLNPFYSEKELHNFLLQSTTNKVASTIFEEAVAEETSQKFTFGNIRRPRV